MTGPPVHQHRMSEDSTEDIHLIWANDVGSIPVAIQEEREAGFELLWLDRGGDNSQSMIVTGRSK